MGDSRYSLIEFALKCNLIFLGQPPPPPGSLLPAAPFLPSFLSLLDAGRSVSPATKSWGWEGWGTPFVSANSQLKLTAPCLALPAFSSHR